MGIREVLTAPRSPWQNPYAERFIGTLRRECLDHIIVFNESSLRHILKAYFEYYEHSRTHLALKTRQYREPLNLEKLVLWASYRRWADCIIAMSEEPPEHADGSGCFSSALKRMEWRSSVTSTIASSCWRPQAAAACGDDQ